MAGEKQAATRRLRQEWFRDYMQNKACVDCSEADPVVLQFDHVRGEKLENVSNMLTKGRSVERILAEIAKCDVVCANCHTRRTAKQQRWHWIC